MQAQAGPISIQVQGGAAAGISNSEMTKLVKAGVSQGCRGETTDRIGSAADPMLSMIWQVIRSGPGPVVIVPVLLQSKTRRVGFAFDRLGSPGAAPRVVFEYGIATLTCRLYKNAGYLTAVQ